MPPRRRSPAPSPPNGDALRERPLVRAAIDRTMEDRYSAAADEIARIVDAAYRVIERTGEVAPTMRDLLSEAGLSTQAFYRHFPSKDDLLLVLLDDGRRRLANYLEHQMQKASTPADQVRAWARGVFAQAVDPAAAARTRPFLSNLGRLAEQYPDEQQASVDALVDLLEAAIAEGTAAGTVGSDDPRADALAVYHLVSSAMQSHVLAGTAPTKDEIEAYLSFIERALAIGAP